MIETQQPLGLFEGYGIEIELMIVDRETLDVRPVTDEVLKAVAGNYESEVELDGFCWSNELVLHVIEIKTNGPRNSLDGLGEEFLSQVGAINRILNRYNACLMPTAMHPWMNPDQEARLWPHENNEIYAAYNRIFDCRGHGWSNLQSVHINLPFANEEEFVHLHTAIRLALPLLPALAASSPLVELKSTGFRDSRLEVYRKNQKKVPSVTGFVVPESISSFDEYQTLILKKIYRDISPYDPEGILQYEWLNSRGAIARFDRNTIEVRVIDTQESPLVDLAIAQACVAVIRALVEEQWCSFEIQKQWSTDTLSEFLLGTIRDGDDCLIKDPEYLKLFGIHKGIPMTANSLWRLVLEDLGLPMDSTPLSVIQEEGCLSKRILKAVGPDTGHPHALRVYRQLCDCLAEGRPFRNGSC